MNISSWVSKNTRSLLGKTVAITGATGGLGEELCMYLAECEARLILLCRNKEKFSALKEKILRRLPNAEINFILVDLESMEQIKSAAVQLVSQDVDILILNAGAYSIPRRIASSGFDNVFQINFVSQYYLARKLLPQLGERRGRVVAVSSIAHNYSKIKADNIDFRDIKASSLAYGNAKRHLTYGLRELFREEDAELSIVHPGIALTGITAHYPKLIFALIKYPMKLIFMKPKIACLSLLYGVFKTTPSGRWIGPWFLDIWGRPKLKPLTTARDEEIKTIFKRAEEIYISIENKKA